jgi:hypothetical protein
MEDQSTAHKRKASSPLPFTAVKRARAAAGETPGTTRKVIRANPMIFVEPQNPDARLDGLPDELLLVIFKEMDKDVNKCPLVRMCLMNKRYRNIAYEVIYEKLTFYWPGREPRKMQTVANNPHLGQYVKIYRNSTTMDQGEHLISTTNHAVNLREISITSSGIRDLQSSPQYHPLWVRFLEATTCNAPSSFANKLTHLKTLSVYAYGQIIPIEKCTVVFRLPSLESLHLAGLCESDPLPEWDVPAASSNIKRLRLDGCCFDSTIVVQMLSCIKALEHLNYRYHHRYSKDRSLPDHEQILLAHSTYSEIGAALSTQVHSLKSLVFSEGFIGRSAQNLLYPEGRNAGTFSLQSFHKLKSITTPFEALLDFKSSDTLLLQRLPAGLEELGLSIIPSRAKAFLCAPALLSVQNLFTGPKKRMRIVVHCMGTDVFRELQLASVTKALEEVGIDVHVDRRRTDIYLYDSGEHEDDDDEEGYVSEVDEDHDDNEDAEDEEQEDEEAESESDASDTNAIDLDEGDADTDA